MSTIENLKENWPWSPTAASAKVDDLREEVEELEDKVRQLEALFATVCSNPNDARQVETVARATCLISPRHRTADKCLFHGEYETAPGSGFCQIGSSRARAALTALAASNEGTSN